MAYLSKDSAVQARQLEAQQLVAVCDVVNAKSDLPSLITINNATIADSKITVDLKEELDKVFLVQVSNKATGANVALEAVTVTGSTVEVQVDGTSLTSACIHVIYKVKE